MSPAWQADSSPTEPPLNTKGRITSLHLAIWAPLVAQTVKSLPAMQETWVQSLGQEDPLEEGMATHDSILASGTPWTEEPGCIQSIESQDVGYTLETKQQQKQS